MNCTKSNKNKNLRLGQDNIPALPLVEWECQDRSFPSFFPFLFWSNSCKLKERKKGCKINSSLSFFYFLFLLFLSSFFIFFFSFFSFLFLLFFFLFSHLFSFSFFLPFAPFDPNTSWASSVSWAEFPTPPFLYLIFFKISFIVLLLILGANFLDESSKFLPLKEMKLACRKSFRTGTSKFRSDVAGADGDDAVVDLGHAHSFSWCRRTVRCLVRLWEMDLTAALSSEDRKRMSVRCWQGATLLSRWKLSVKIRAHSGGGVEASWFGCVGRI